VSFWPTLGGGCGLLNFLELSGVGRVMDHEVDEDATRTERLDGWIVWETWGREGGAGWDGLDCMFFFSLPFSFYLFC